MAELGSTFDSVRAFSLMSDFLSRKSSLTPSNTELAMHFGRFELALPTAVDDQPVEIASHLAGSISSPRPVSPTS